MLNCFFGAELKPDGVPVNFKVPKGTSLVITQCAVTSVVPPRQAPGEAAGAAASSSASSSHSYSPVTLCVQGHGVPTRFAVCSLSPAQQITYCPLQLIFSKPVSFALVPQTVSPNATAAAAGAAVTPLRHVGKKAPRAGKGEKAGEAHGNGGAASATAVYPTVHLTGYFEQAAEEDEDEEGMAMHVMEDGDGDDDFSDDE